VTLASLIVAWVVGVQRSHRDIENALKKAFPEYGAFQQLSSQILQFGRPGGDESPQGYVSLGTAYGYGGPLTVAVVFDQECRIQKLALLDHKESIPFFAKVQRSGLPESFIGLSCLSLFMPEDGVDSVSGATLSSRAVAEAVRGSSHRVARESFALSPPELGSPAVSVGLKEIALVFLFLVSLCIFGLRFKFKKTVRWMTLILSILVLGFGFGTLLTLGNISAMLLGYWPNWRTHLYWYLLLAIVFVPLILRGREFYCRSICPFGAVQECLGVVGGAKERVPRRIREFLRWLPRVLAWLLIFVALLSQNPGIQTHEVFGAAFQLTGTTGQFILMALVLMAALVLTRPWCAYLCPIKGVTDFIKSLRSLWAKRSSFSSESWN
jgi:hypothetical protein